MALWTALFLTGLAATVYFGNTIFIAFESDRPSVSRGTPGRGSLRDGKRLPSNGPNFRAYSRLGALLGRNSVHATIRTVVLEAYAEVAKKDPALRFVYGETGWPTGGRFSPHRTHQNGLSVDFMMPVRDAGRPVDLPTWPWQRFGYDLEFDTAGRRGRLTIDFDAMAVHLTALEASARRHGTRISLLILAPEYYELLWRTEAGKHLQGRLPVMPSPAWIRHDDHYHVDFAPPAG
jgi:penicillin-insensitive murein endopeptidase